MTSTRIPAERPRHDADRRDEVDELANAWNRELPGVSTEPMQVWSRILRLSIHLDDARRATFATHELEGWEFDVLAALRRCGAPYTMTPGQLIRETHVTSGTMTNRVDRLVGRGLVERRADPADRRQVRVVLTDDGRRLVDAAMGDLLLAEQHLLGGLAEPERSALADGLRTLLLAQSSEG